MIKFKFSWTRFVNSKKPLISKRWIVKETDKTVWFWSFETHTGNRKDYVKCKELKECAGVRYYDTFEEAKEHAIRHGKNRLEAAEKNLEEAKAYHNAALIWQESDCYQKAGFEYTDEGAAQADFIDGKPNK